jgi:NTE family protein
LRRFWEMVTDPPFEPALEWIRLFAREGDRQHRLVNQLQAGQTLLKGAPKFFEPRFPPPYLMPPGALGAVSFYDTAPLKQTLLELVDFDRLNSGELRFAVGAVNVATGNFAYFDNGLETPRILPEHIMASGALPPGFPPIEIDGQFYWDGGLVSNTPLQWVFDSRPRMDRLVFQVDLWNARGLVPKDLIGVEVRQKEIQYSSRTRAATDQYKYTQKLRIAAANLLSKLPEDLRNTEDAKLLATEANNKVCNIVHLIYRARAYEGVAKDYEFSRRTMEEHWKSGYDNATLTLSTPGIMELPDRQEGVKVFDVCKGDAS